MAQPAVDMDTETVDSSKEHKSWISSLADQLLSKSSKNNEEQKSKQEEDNDIMTWFSDITSGAESNRTGRDILNSFRKDLKSENMFSRFADKKLRKAAITFGKLSHRLDLSYPPKSKLTPIDFTTDTGKELLADLKYCIRHSLAAYKKMKLAYTTLEKSVVFKSTKTLLRDYLDIDTKDIVIDNSTRNLKQWKNHLHAPRFYLCIDHKLNRIILCVRGTDTNLDRLSDINCTAKAYNAFNVDGYAHEGILASAKYVVDNVTCDIVKQCKLYPEYELIITGHSLGGGVAAMLGLMYYQHPIICRPNKLRVFAFASPPVISKEFIENDIGLEYIYSIALTTDFVTRLSKEAVRHHNVRNDLVLKAKDEVIEECLTILNDYDDEEKKDEFENERIKFCRKLKEIDSPNIEEKLFPIGKILWFVPKVVMEEEDFVVRTSSLMSLHDDDDDDDDDSDEMEKKVKEKKNTKEDKFKYSLKRKLAEMSNKCKEKKEQRAIKKKQKSAIVKYGAHNYVLCEATNCRDWFQNFVVDFPESFLAHVPGRYLWACGTTMTGDDIPDP